MDYAFIAYVFLAFVITAGAGMQLFKSNRMWAAILVLILFVLIFYFFGVRWFRGTSLLGGYQGSWPPIVNACPDYLVYYRRGTQDTCVDLLGVNRSGGVLVPWNQEDTPQNPPADDRKYFPYVFKPGMKPDELQKLCNFAQQAGLTWEGITNGESCTFTTATGAVASAAQKESCKTA